MSYQKLIKKLERQRDEVGKRRDAIRDVAAECEDLEAVCTRAYESLNEAIDALSELT